MGGQPFSTMPTPGGFQARSVAEVVTSGLCIGCGLCEAVTAGRVGMRMTAKGSLRPVPADGFTPEEEATILSCCPGVAVEARRGNAASDDLIWGSHTQMRHAWAGDALRRLAGSSGGVLTALGCHLLDQGRVGFVLHVGAHPEMPMRSLWVRSRTAADVQRNAGSRYGPVAPLAGLVEALDAGERFAIIAKPCDLSAVHRLSKRDPRVDALCVARFALVCGGQSRLGKSEDLLRRFGVEEGELSLFRYRGYGNPGRTRVETRDGRAFEVTYTELWEDEAGWEIETRCKLCPDALGETADIVAADVWPGCNPTGEDAGFNGIVVRSALGEKILASAVAKGDIVLGDPITPRQFDTFQPHQVRKKEALTARYAGMARAGSPVIATSGLRLAEIAARADPDLLSREEAGAFQRASEGRFAESLPRPPA